VPTFQVTYVRLRGRIRRTGQGGEADSCAGTSQNLKILTTALFSVILLRRRLTSKKWLALFFLAAGVGVVQLQSTAAAETPSQAAEGLHRMDRFKGMLAVGSACLTSGLAGVYFEMVLKGSKADLWIRNVQLSFFSLLPALVPVFLPDLSVFSSSAHAPPPERQAIFAHFGAWAWAVVLIQVLGGLVTALVIKFR
jgi:UDP-sugar transporter A1/2/3